MRARKTAVIVSSTVLLIHPASVAASSSPCPYVWSTNLRMGSSGQDVVALQRFLNANDFVIAADGPGSPGNETQKYGALTRAAVIKFQEAYAADVLAPSQLSVGTGTFGPATRSKANSLCVSATESQGSTSTQPTEDLARNLLTVSDPGQEPNALIPTESAALFLQFDLTAGDEDVTVNTIVLRRTGIGSDAAFYSLALWGVEDGGLQVGNPHSFDSNHEAVFRTPFTIPANTTMEIQVYGYMNDLTDHEGEMPAVELARIDASAPIVGDLPLVGPMQTLNTTISIGGASAYRSSYDPSTDISRSIGDTRVRFAGIRIEANSHEDLSLYNMIWRQNGSASSADIANVAVVAGGVEYPVKVREGRDYIAVFDPEIVIAKGSAMDVYIKGDILPGAANRTVKFDIHDNVDDINLGGNKYGFGVSIAAGGNTANSGNSVFLTDTGDTDGDALVPFYSGPLVTVQGGTLVSVTK